MNLHRALREGLILGFLMIACSIGLQISYLLRQSGIVLVDFQRGYNDLGIRAAVAMENLNDTVVLARETLSQQRGYYRDSASALKALTKAAALDAASLGRLIENSDERMERLTQAAITAIGVAQDDADRIALVSERVAAETQKTLAAAQQDFLATNRLLSDPAIPEGLASMNRSLANLEAMTAELTVASRNAASATGHLNDMLSPKKRGFWKTALKFALHVGAFGAWKGIFD